MATSEINANGHTARIEVEEVRLRSWGGSELDPAWTFTDAQGHRHYHAGPDTPHGERFPTLTWRSRWLYCEDCREDHDYGDWFCPKCGEKISPGTRPVPPMDKVVPGPRTYFIDDRQVTEEEFQAFVQQAREEADRG